MNIKLSYRDVQADTKDNHHEVSETSENNPKLHQNIDLMKPRIDVRIKMDEERAANEKNISMGINCLNQLERGK